MESKSFDVFEHWMKTKGCSIAKIWSDVTSNIRRTIRQGALQCYDTDSWKIPIGDYDGAGQPDVRLRMRLQFYFLPF